MYRLTHWIALAVEEGTGDIVPYDTIKPASFHVRC